MQGRASQDAAKNIPRDTEAIERMRSAGDYLWSCLFTLSALLGSSLTSGGVQAMTWSCEARRTFTAASCRYSAHQLSCTHATFHS